MRSVIASFFLLSFLSSSAAFAFPEMIRMGYPNCTSCHVSPSGGGLMTDYGRSIAAEALSTWAYPKEELPGHGYLPEPPAWLKIGGDVRVIQTYIDNAQATAKSFFLMQSDLELGFNFGRFWYVQDLGIQGGPERAPNRGEFVAHRYYALYNLNDESYVRAGKYLLPYGLNIPDHTSFIRRNLGFDQGQETYNLDIGMIGEVWNSILAISFGRKEDPVDLEKGASLQVGYNHGDTHKIMGSLAYLKKEDVSSRILLGPQIIWGFNSKLVFLGEYDYQEKTLEGATKTVQKGAVTYSRLQYEVKKGVNPYLLHQLSYLDFTQLRTRTNSVGAGVLWYPRPHLELTTEVDYSETAQINAYNTVGWILGHYYF
ncbi:hypothetical protein [Bdellovibrio sp. HCB337]|uniref:hypothetical protein n=1 Tax=Bdellovibrio sp. HCB337 TaxID=3394358 RepID=UPI0039A55FBC